MDLFLECKDYVMRSKAFLVGWIVRTGMVFFTYAFTLQELEKFKNQDYSASGASWIYPVSIAQFVLIFGNIFLFRRNIESERKVTGEGYILFLLRMLLFIVGLVALIVCIAFGVSQFFQLPVEFAKDPSVTTKSAILGLINLLFPSFLVYSALATARFRVLPKWEDTKRIFSDNTFRIGWSILLLLFGIVFWGPVFAVGFPNPEDMDAQYSYAKITIYTEMLPLVFVELIHFGLIFVFVRKFGGIEIESREEEIES
ncbi:hypothetical protein CH371_13725 [Leptospira wolffii]|uniref:Uncharacterized protein n=1 Tax=Leptospira wolffii TaxID=409998 RepID=A0A2M9ZAK7_9LEPT|nr:hypothetical protein [Leptospira wolffii]PJZ65443.1 hypothetical protein CH371_13725 [Leptospira wolffii]